jgi:hypothetical protein
MVTELGVSVEHLTAGPSLGHALQTEAHRTQ